MTLGNINTKQRGFTIVELLIVIVVIAILAAITIVAYNGIQNRAKTSQYQADANAIVKVAEALNAREDGTGYPGSPADFPGATDVKLPANLDIKEVNAEPAVNASPDLATTPGKKIYSVKFCTASPNSTGIVVYYTDVAANTVKKMNAGRGC